MECKHLFSANLIQNIKIVCLSWNLVLRLIRICWIWWWCSLFSVLDCKYPFWTNLVQKIKTICLKWNLVPNLIGICWIRWECSFVLLCTGSSFCGAIWSKRNWIWFEEGIEAWHQLTSVDILGITIDDKLKFYLNIDKIVWSLQINSTPLIV